MLTRDEFAALIKTQFVMFQNVANSLFVLAIQNHKTGFAAFQKETPRADLKVAGQSFLNSFQTLADGHLAQLGINDAVSAKVFESQAYDALKAIVNISLTQILKEIRTSELKRTFKRTVGGPPVFAQLEVKKRDAIGRGYESAYSAQVVARQFAVLAELYAQYSELKKQNVTRIDIINLNDYKVLKTINIDKVFDIEYIVIFHPNSYIRIQAHDA